MRLRLRILFVVVLVLALGALLGFGIWAGRNQEARAEREVRALLEARLNELTATASQTVSQLEGRLLILTENLPREPDRIRALTRTQPNLGRLLVLGPKRTLEFPPLDGPRSEGERRLVEESRDLWDRGTLAHPPRDEATGRVAPHGWLARRGGDGMGLCFWRQRSDGGTVAIEIPSVTLLAQLVGHLPSTTSGKFGRPGRSGTSNGDSLALLDENGAIAYRWGTFRTPLDAKPLSTLTLPVPLGAFRLAYLGPAPRIGPATTGIVAGVAALALAILGTGFWLYRESTRDLRQAAERVSFVNQVSHELKTPLTNVRLYADLLEDHVAPDDAVGQQRLGVLVSESQRLSRLITNILTFARRDKGRLTIHRVAGCLDDAVRAVLVQFGPGFADSSTSVTFIAGAPGRVLLDVDAVCQMLGNLLSNVEKYAAGRDVEIKTNREGSEAIVTVHDQGPGIPEAERERIFEPFVRLQGHAHEGVPGTGIGLSIARDLARMHGGDLRVENTERGACFRLSLRAEVAS